MKTLDHDQIPEDKNIWRYEGNFDIFVALEQNRQHIVPIADMANYEQLFKTHYNNLCSYANKYLEDLDAAEEVVQDVFVKLWENRETISITGSFKSYIFRAVRNACLNFIRHLQVREEFKTYNEQELERNQPLLEDEIHASELEVRIRAAINLLPAERRKVFIMSRYDGLKYKEIAEKLNISDKTVENQMGRAIKFLREKLTKYMVINIVYLLKLLSGNGWG